MNDSWTIVLLTLVPHAHVLLLDSVGIDHGLLPLVPDESNKRVFRIQDGSLPQHGRGPKVSWMRNRWVRSKGSCCRFGTLLQNPRDLEGRWKFFESKGVHFVQT